MIDNRKVYKSKDFALLWHKYQKENPDYPRILLSNPLIEKSLGRLRGKIVLDAGCGNGFFLQNILKKKPRLVFAVDISKYLIGIAKNEVRSETVRFRVCDLTKKMPFKNNFFDAIISYNVLVDMPRIGTAFREMFRTLKPKGKAVVCVVHPLYNLFVNDAAACSESVFARLKRYAKAEPLKVTTLSSFENFVVFRRPVEEYAAKASNASFKIKKIFPIAISSKLSKKNKKYIERTGLPIFLFMELEK